MAVLTHSEYRTPKQGTDIYDSAGPSTRNVLRELMWSSMALLVRENERVHATLQDEILTTPPHDFSSIYSFLHSWIRAWRNFNARLSATGHGYRGEHSRRPDLQVNLYRVSQTTGPALTPRWSIIDGLDDVVELHFHQRSANQRIKTSWLLQRSAEMERQPPKLADTRKQWKFVSLRGTRGTTPLAVKSRTQLIEHVFPLIELVCVLDQTALFGLSRKPKPHRIIIRSEGTTAASSLYSKRVPVASNFNVAIVVLMDQTPDLDRLADTIDNLVHESFGMIRHLTGNPRSAVFVIVSTKSLRSHGLKAIIEWLFADSPDLVVILDRTGCRFPKLLMKGEKEIMRSDAICTSGKHHSLAGSVATKPHLIRTLSSMPAPSETPLSSMEDWDIRLNSHRRAEQGLTVQRQDNRSYGYSSRVIIKSGESSKAFRQPPPPHLRDSSSLVLLGPLRTAIELLSPTERCVEIAEAITEQPDISEAKVEARQQASPQPADSRIGLQSFFQSVLLRLRTSMCSRVSLGSTRLRLVAMGKPNIRRCINRLLRPRVLPGHVRLTWSCVSNLVRTGMAYKADAAAALQQRAIWRFLDR